MKQKIYILGIITAVIIVAGTLMKINHMPGAGKTLATGIALFIFVFIPMALVSNYRKEGNRQNRLLYIVTWLTCFVIFSAMLFKIQHWPLAGVLLYIAIPFPYLVFLPVFLYVTGKINNFNIYNTVFVLLLFATNSVFSVLLSLNVSKTRIDDSYTLSGNSIKLSEALSNLTDKSDSSRISIKIDNLLITVSQYKDLILKHEGLSRKQWDKNPGNLLRPDAKQDVFDALKGHESFPGKRLQEGIGDLISELARTHGQELLAKAAPSIFYNSDGHIFNFENVNLSWALIYLDKLEADLRLIKMSI